MELFTTTTTRIDTILNFSIGITIGKTFSILLNSLWVDIFIPTLLHIHIFKRIHVNITNFQIFTNVKIGEFLLSLIVFLFSIQCSYILIAYRNKFQ